MLGALRVPVAVHHHGTVPGHSRRRARAAYNPRIDERFPGQDAAAQELRRFVPLSDQPEDIPPLVPASEGSEGENCPWQTSPGPPAVAGPGHDLSCARDQGAIHRLRVDHSQRRPIQGAEGRDGLGNSDRLAPRFPREPRESQSSPRRIIVRSRKITRNFSLNFPGLIRLGPQKFTETDPDERNHPYSLWVCSSMGFRQLNQEEQFRVILLRKVHPQFAEDFEARIPAIERRRNRAVWIR